MIKFAAPTPASSMSQYVSNAVQIGTIVTIALAASALAFDSVEEMGVFLRTRTSRSRPSVAPDSACGSRR